MACRYLILYVTHVSFETKNTLLVFLRALSQTTVLFVSQQVERYDPLIQRWTTVKPMLSRRCRLGVATLNGKIYVCGGYDGSTFLQTVEMFDPAVNEYVSTTKCSH